MFSKLVCLLIKSITETLKCLIFFILLLGSIGADYLGKENFKLIGLSGLVLYLLVIASMTFINKNNKMKSIKTFSCIVVSFISSFLIIRNLDLQYKLFCLLYLLAVIIFAIIHYCDEIKDFKLFIRGYISSTSFCLLYICALQSSEFIEVIKIYFPMYLIMSILYIVQVNILKEYNDFSSNLINKERNIGRLNLISISITIISTLIFTTDLFNRIYDFANYSLKQFIYILLKPVSIIASWCYSHCLVIPKDLFKKNEFVSNLFQIFSCLIFIIPGCLCIYYMYKILGNIKRKNNNLSIWDILKEALTFRMDKPEEIGKSRNKEKLKDLHVIRKIYIDVIKILKTKGVEYNSSYTPNEYNEIIETTEFKSKNLDQLVNIYNGLRYGNKSISKEEISKASKIKESLLKNCRTK